MFDVTTIFAAIGQWFAVTGHSINWDDPPWAWIVMALLAGMILIKVLERLGK